MKNTLSLKFLTAVFAAQTAFSVNASAQTTELPAPKNVNFVYSKNPKTRTKKEAPEVKNLPPTTAATDNTNTAQIENQTTETTAEFESRSLAKNTSEVVKRLDTSNVSPTEIYKIGVGDVLFISLQNAPSKASTYYTVLNDGKIDYALAGEMVSVSGMTTEEVEDLLKEKIKVYENPQISVKVREHASHTITVLGMVEKAGEKYLQREAMPLFIVKAEAIVQPKANFVTIKRTNSETETVDLKDAKADDVLIFPGDIVEFKLIETTAAVVDSNAPQFYFIGGSVVSAGQKDFHQGLTLTQSILASGGLRNQKIKKVVIRRKNEKGLLSPIEFDLNAIKNGKQPDPVLQAGDTIEVVN
jgi:polysaccharide export outer membrane protein